MLLKEKMESTLLLLIYIFALIVGLFLCCLDLYEKIYIVALIVGLLLCFCCLDLYMKKRSSRVPRDIELGLQSSNDHQYKYEDEEQNRNYNESLTNGGRTTRAAQARQEERQGESVRPHPQQEPRPDQTSQRTDGKTANAERNISKERWDTEGPMEDLPGEKAGQPRAVRVEAKTEGDGDPDDGSPPRGDSNKANPSQRRA